MGKMLNEHEVADFLRIKKDTLYRWRKAGTGPDYYKIGSKIIYDEDLLIEYLKKNRVVNER